MSTAEKEIKGILVFYIDVGMLPPQKAEAFVERMKKEFNKTDNFLERLKNQGYETIWIPVRPNTKTHVDLLPLSEDALTIIRKRINKELIDCEEDD